MNTGAHYDVIHRGYVIRLMRYEDTRAGNAGQMYVPEKLQFFRDELELARQQRTELVAAAHSRDRGRQWLEDHGYKPGYIVSVSGVYEIEERLVEDE